MTNRYAFIKDNEVINVVLFEELTPDIYNVFKNEHSLDDIISCALDPKHAVMGASWDGETFTRPAPFPSWVLNEDRDWVAPVAVPDTWSPYVWDEDSLNWVLLT
jgi:hypothetical protein